ARSGGLRVEELDVEPARSLGPAPGPQPVEDAHRLDREVSGFGATTVPAQDPGRLEAGLGEGDHPPGGSVALDGLSRRFDVVVDEGSRAQPGAPRRRDPGGAERALPALL